MNEKIKKVLSYLGSFFGGALALLLYFRFSKRYMDVRGQLKSASKSVDGAISRLDELEKQRGKVSESNQAIRDSLEHERRSIEEIRRGLTDNAAILTRSEQRIAECQAIIDKCKQGIV